MRHRGPLRSCLSWTWGPSMYTLRLILLGYATFIGVAGATFVMLGLWSTRFRAWVEHGKRLELALTLALSAMVALLASVAIRDL
jgi:apolipoprotein N-acyltransferase